MQKYEMIKEYLREEALKPSSTLKMPTVRTLTRQFSVATATVLRALQELEYENIIRRRHGSGIVAVRPDSIDANLTMKRNSSEEGVRKVVYAAIDYPSESIWQTNLMVEQTLRKFILNREIYEEVIRDAVPKAKHRLWIASADIKDMYVACWPQDSRSANSCRTAETQCGYQVYPCQRTRFKEPGSTFRQYFDYFPGLWKHLERVLCPRVHFKWIIIDGRPAYFSSANLTGAGMEAKGSVRWSQRPFTPKNFRGSTRISPPLRRGNRSFGTDGRTRPVTPHLFPPLAEAVPREYAAPVPARIAVAGRVPPAPERNAHF